MPEYRDRDETHFPGWYGVKMIDDCGGERWEGPFRTQAEALDWESDGLYSDYLLENRRERRDLDADYRRDMRDAGRAHLLRDDD